MKKEFMKKITGLIAAALFFAALAFTGCGNGDSANTIGTSNEEFFLGAYSTPPNGEIGDAPWGLQPSSNTEESWRILKEAGYNYAIPIWHDFTHANIITTLTNAQKVGVKVIIEDRVPVGIPEIMRASSGVSYEETAEKISKAEDAIKSRYDGYTEFESFAGIVVIDEPSALYFDAIAAGQDWWLRNYPEYIYYVTLFPSYSSQGQLFGSGSTGIFREYVETFINKTNPAFISYDNYPLIRSGMQGTVHPSWLSDLEVFAEAGRENKIPFHMYFLTTQFVDRMAPQFYKEIAWQCYSAMAYGVRGLKTFTYWGYFVPDGNNQNLGTGLVDAYGNRMPVYYAVQEVFKEIRSFEKLYMNFTWDGTMTIGTSGIGSTFSGLKNRLKTLDGVSSAAATEDALIGQFKDKDGNRAYMVTNYATPYIGTPNTVTIKFNNAKKVLICKKGRQIVQTVKNNTIELEMGGGEGFFVIPL